MPSDLDEWSRRIFEEPPPIERLPITINGEDYVLTNATVRIVQEETDDIDTVEIEVEPPKQLADDPFKNFKFEIVDPTVGATE